MARRTEPFASAARCVYEPVELTGGERQAVLLVDGVNGYELWKSDGTVEGTQRVRPVVGSDAASVGGSLYFNAGALWKSDGTEAGTAPVTLSSMNPRSITDVESAWRRAPARAAGVAARTPAASPVRVADLLHDTFGSDPSNLTDVQGTLLFTAAGSLWRSDGSVGGTRAFAGVGVLPDSRLGPVMDGRLYFAGGDGITSSLWRSDGTEVGTTQVADVADPYRLTRVGHTLFFFGYDPAHGYELWKSDGSAAVPRWSRHQPRSRRLGIPTLWRIGRRSPDGSAGREARFSFELAAVGGSLFGASDGTTAASADRRHRRRHRPPAELVPSQLTAFNGTLFFTTDTGGLWKSDGTAAGTVRVAAVDPSGLTSGLTGLDGVLYFFLTSRFSFQPTFLWRSDGSEASGRPRNRETQDRDSRVMPRPCQKSQRDAHSLSPRSISPRSRRAIRTSQTRSPRDGRPRRSSITCRPTRSSRSASGPRWATRSPPSCRPSRARPGSTRRIAGTAATA
jgi:ELWxxDGT repeat protein